MSLRVKRTRPPTLKKGSFRCCCSLRTVGTEIFSMVATSGIISSSNPAELSIDIHVKEHDNCGNCLQ